MHYPGVSIKIAKNNKNIYMYGHFHQLSADFLQKGSTTLGPTVLQVAASDRGPLKLYILKQNGPL